MNENRVIHTLQTEEREKLTVTGVSDIVRFDDTAAVLITSCGKLTIKGSNIKVISLDIDSAEKSIRLEGEFSSFEYGRFLGTKNGNLSERLFGK